MFKRIDNVLSAAQLAELHAIADTATFVDGRITNPHNETKRNLHMHDQQGSPRASQLMANALFAHPGFRDFAFPRAMMPPMLTVYRPDMQYGLHTDAPFMRMEHGQIRTDVSCTLFLSRPEDYDGGALRVMFGEEEILIKMAAGSAILYASTTLHEVTPVTRGERRVGVTFIQSTIADPGKRELLYELNEVAALEGLGMRRENYTRLQRVQNNLLRRWGGSA